MKSTRTTKATKPESSKKKDSSRTIKQMNLRFPKDLWMFLKHDSAEREVSVNTIVIEQLTKYKDKKQG